MNPSLKWRTIGTTRNTATCTFLRESVIRYVVEQVTKKQKKGKDGESVNGKKKKKKSREIRWSKSRNPSEDG